MSRCVRRSQDAFRSRTRAPTGCEGRQYRAARPTRRRAMLWSGFPCVLRPFACSDPGTAMLLLPTPLWPSCGEGSGAQALTYAVAVPLHLPPPLWEGWGVGRLWQCRAVFYDPHPRPLPTRADLCTHVVGCDQLTQVGREPCVGPWLCDSLFAD